MSLKSYDGSVKDRHRAMVLYDALADPRGRKVLYVESELGEATAFFLKHGLAASRLLPVHWTTDGCAEIRRRTGVPALCEDVFDHLVWVYSKTRLSFACIWLDLQCRTLRADALHAALHLAPRVEITLTFLYAKLDVVQDRALSLVSQCGGVVDECAVFRGKSGRRNMLRMCARLNVGEEERDRKRERERVGKQENERKKETKPTWSKKPSSSHEITPKKAISKGSTTKTKRTTRSQGGATWTRHKVVLDVQSLVGTTVKLPTREWSDKQDVQSWQADVLQRGGKLHFRVVSTYWHTRLAVKAVRPNGTLAQTKERWTLTPEQVIAYR